MQNIIKKILLSFILVAIFFVTDKAYSQDQFDYDEVKVIAPYEPTISDAFKITDAPVIEDTIRISRDLVYSITPVKLKTRFEVMPINVARMRGEPLSKLYNGFVKGGFGTHTTPYGELFYNSLRSNEYAYGVRLKHLSSAGKIADYPHSAYSDNLVEVFGKRFFRNHILDAGANYERNVVHFYGANNDNIIDNFEQLTKKDLLRQTYNYFSANTGFRNNTLDSLKLSYDMDLNYNFLADDYDATQHNINFKGTVQRQLPPDPMGFSEDQHFKLDAYAINYNNESPIGQVSGSLFGLKPRLSSSFKDFKFYLGFDAAIQSDSTTYFRIHPVAGTDVYLIDNALAAYAYLTGGVQRHNLYDLYRENPFINSDLEYRFMNTKSEIAGGFKGSISSYVSYNVSIRNSIIENYAFFVTDFDDGLNNKMTVLYDDVILFNFRVEIFSQLAQRLSVRFISNYNEYTLDNEIEAWHKPTTQFDLSVNYNIRDKLIFKVDAFARNSSYARIFVGGEEDRKKIYGFHVDASIGVEYRYTKLLSVFLSFNNVQNQPLERWLNYPSQRFNFLGGVTYAF